MKGRSLLLFLSLFLLGAFALLLISFTIFIEPSVKIGGIEDGKVYAKHPVIHLVNSFGDVHVTLNGKDVKPNYTVKENGSYLLQGESTILWKKKRVVYKFEVDDKPPSVPRIKEAVDKVYFKQAKFTLDKEEHVTYKAALNGKEISIDQPINKIGKNILTITAMKSNGLTSKKEISFLIDEKTFPKKNINQFVDYYFKDDVPFIYKFTGNVAINLEGNFNKDDVKMVETAIKEIKKFFPYEIEIADGFSSKFDRYIKMVFTSTDDFKAYTVDRDDVWGVHMSTRISPVYGTMESLALVGTDKEITRDYRNGVILHELLHAVGLVNHIQSSQSNSLLEFADGVVALGTEDKKYGELLYLGEVKPNFTKEKVMAVLEQRIQ